MFEYIKLNKAWYNSSGEKWQSLNSASQSYFGPSCQPVRNELEPNNINIIAAA